MRQRFVQSAYSIDWYRGRALVCFRRFAHRFFLRLVLRIQLVLHNEPLVAFSPLRLSLRLFGAFVARLRLWPTVGSAHRATLFQLFFWQRTGARMHACVWCLVGSFVSPHVIYIWIDYSSL